MRDGMFNSIFSESRGSKGCLGLWRIFGFALMPPIAPNDSGPGEEDTTMWGQQLKEEVKKGGGHMNKRIFDKKIHMGDLRIPLRRIMAGLLAVTMLLPMVNSAMAANTIIWPIQAVHEGSVDNTNEHISDLTDSADFPNVEIESNFVRDEFGFLTGYLELGLRAQTPAGKYFQSLEVTLEYDTSFLTPVDWTNEGKEIVLGLNRPDGTQHPNADLGHTYDYYSEQLAVEVWPELSGGTAHSGWPETAATNITTGVGDNSRALLSLEARSAVSNDNEKVKLPEMTTLAVVRFKISEEMMDKISIVKTGEKDGGNKDIYAVRYDGTIVENMVQLKNAMINTAASDGDTGTTSEVEEMVCFADDGDIAIANPFTGMMLHYQGDFSMVGLDFFKTEYYYTDVTTETQVTEEYDGHSYTLTKPDTKAQLPYPAKNLALGDGENGKYSYLTNLIYNELMDPAQTDGARQHINFTIASKRSFVDSKDLLGNVTTIVYVDWDNTLLGTQIVPKGVDLRGLVSDYVAENFIYHDNDDTTYGDNDINDPAQSAAQSGRTARDVVMSLSRLDNYRGKYPANGPAPDGTKDDTTVDYNTTDEPVGKDYPLTNKLDYVFFKRPMTHPDEPDATTYPLGKDDPQYKADMETWATSNEWVQKTNTTTGGAEWGPFGVGASYDEEHPYAYGWAICTAENYEDIWTTLGSNGELNNYEEKYICPDCGWEATEAEILNNGGQCPDCASSNADPSMNEGIAKVTYEGEGFQFADLEKGFTEDTVFLKAIYEPGDDLMSSAFFYRMIKVPYYNKVNPAIAANGGSYSATFVFERSNNTQGGDDYVRGVARLREPAVRGEATADNLWEYWENEGEVKVNHDLPSATLQEAKDATKSTFLRVAVENEEEIEVVMTLSGRQNKINYFLRDEYNSNFVAGQQRSNPNMEEMVTTDANGNSTYTKKWIADNYNYFVEGQSFEKDQWYDAPYESREGSYGFVLFGTLNAIMEKATINQHDATDSEYAQYLSADVLNDINIMDANGNPYSRNSFIRDNVSQIIKDAVVQAENAYTGGNKDWWNEERNCAELTYHQLQYYIMTYKAGSGGTLLPDATEADPVPGLTWCHLHKNCADAVSTKPKDWNELLQAAANNPEDIEKLTPTEAEELTHLRKDHNGTALSVTELKDGLVAAVAAGCSTWDEVQDHIIRVQTDAEATVDVDYARNTYWWYDGATRISLSNWADLLAAARDSYDVSDNPKVPGESAPVLRQAKLKPLEEAFNSNASDLDKNDPAWVRATENLCVDNDGNKFPTFQAFKDALADALERAKNEGVTEPGWHQIQYAILHPTAPVPPVKFEDAGHEPEMDGYWWHNGERKIVDISSMLQAAKDKNSVWAGFTVEQLYDVNRDLHFRKDFKGTKYTEAELSSFKTKVETFVGMYGVGRSWNDLQFYLLHGYTDDYFVVGDEAVYYWWVSNGEGTSVDFSTVTDYNSGVSAFLNAAFRYELNGNVHAWDDLTTDIIRTARFIKEDNNASIFYQDPATDPILVHFDTPAELVTAISGLAAAAGGKGAGLGQMVTLPTATWAEIQYYLLNSQTLPGTAPDYWWRTLDENKVIDPQEYFDAAIAALDESIQNYDTTAINDWCTVDNLNIVFINVNDPSGAGKFTDDDAQAIVGNDAWSELVVNAGFSSGSEVSWYQMQDVLMSGTYNYRSDQDIYDELTGNGFTIPDWVPAPASVMSVRMMLRQKKGNGVEEAIELMTEQIAELVIAAEEDLSLLEENAQQIGKLLAAVDELKALMGGTAEGTSTESPAPAESPVAVESQAPDESTKPIESITPSEFPAPSESVEPIESEAPSESVTPIESEEPVETPAPTEGVESDESPTPAESVRPVESPDPAESVEPGESSASTESKQEGTSVALPNEGGGSDTAATISEQITGGGGEDYMNSNFENGIIALTENYLEQESDLSFQNSPLAAVLTSGPSAYAAKDTGQEGLPSEEIPDPGQSEVPRDRSGPIEQEGSNSVCVETERQISQSESIGRTMI